MRHLDPAGGYPPSRKNTVDRDGMRMDTWLRLAVVNPGEAVGGLADWIANIASGLWTILAQLIDSLFTFMTYQFGLHRASDWAALLVGILLVALASRAILRRAILRGLVLGVFGVAVLALLRI